MKEHLGLLLVLTAILFQPGDTWGSKHERVKLKDVETLTLYHGRMTNGRRSSPVPQLKCVGGTAGCSAYVPQVVQCYNRGSDGRDIQWECKTDMDNLYRFGHIQVSCEGYDYPDDEYILKGSCGLEYTLDLTKEGIDKSHHSGQQHNYYGNNYETHHSTDYSKKRSSGFGDFLLLVVVCIVIYALYKTCLSSRRSLDENSPDQGPYPQHRPSWFGGGAPPPYPSAPPPPGFRQDYTQDTNTGCGSETRRPSGGGGGFWSGATMGGVLGYMFGSRNSNQYTQRPTYSTYQSFGGTGESTYRRSPSSSGTTSSGTRTASGFGGTSRR